jgi:hypothetical protein
MGKPTHMPGNTIFALLCAQVIVLLAQYALTQHHHHHCDCQKQGAVYLEALSRIRAACVAMKAPHNTERHTTSS